MNNLNPAEDYIRAVGGGHSTSAIILGRSGTGKSFRTIKVLQEEGLSLSTTGEEKDKCFGYISGHCTPLQFYNEMYKHKESRVVVIDDVDSLFASKVGLGLLRELTWSNTGSRIASYRSSTKHLQAPSSFEVNSGFILIANKLLRNATVDSIRSRSLVCEFNPTNAELTADFIKVAEKSEFKGLSREERLETACFLSEKSSVATIDFNFRTLIKSWQLMKYAKEKGKEWKPLVSSLLVEDEEMATVKALMDSNWPVSEQIKEYSKLTGKGRRTFYRIMKKIKQRL